MLVKLLRNIYLDKPHNLLEAGQEIEVPAFLARSLQAKGYVAILGNTKTKPEPEPEAGQKARARGRAKQTK